MTDEGMAARRTVLGGPAVVNRRAAGVSPAGDAFGNIAGAAGHLRSEHAADDCAR